MLTQTVRFDAEHHDDIVYPSAIPFLLVHVATVGILWSGVTWTALRNQWYAEGLVAQAARMVEARRVIVAPDDPGTAFVTRRDCAAAASGCRASGSTRGSRRACPPSA